MPKKVYYPKMVYHPHTGAYKICETADDIPEGYVKSLADVVPEETPAKAKPKGKTKPKGKKEPGKSALEALGTTRDEAIEILEDEGVKYADDASDEDIAGLVKDLLD